MSQGGVKRGRGRASGGGAGRGLTRAAHTMGEAESGAGPFPITGSAQGPNAVGASANSRRHSVAPFKGEVLRRGVGGRTRNLFSVGRLLREVGECLGWVSALETGGSEVTEPGRCLGKAPSHGAGGRAEAPIGGPEPGLAGGRSLRTPLDHWAEIARCPWSRDGDPAHLYPPGGSGSRPRVTLITSCVHLLRFLWSTSPNITFIIRKIAAGRCFRAKPKSIPCPLSARIASNCFSEYAWYRKTSQGIFTLKDHSR